MQEFIKLKLFWRLQKAVGYKDMLLIHKFPIHHRFTQAK